MIRIAIDGTAAAVQTAGVGRYTRELLRALLQLPDDDRYQVLLSADAEAQERLSRELPPGAWREFRRLPVPERGMTALWQRLRLPIPVDTFLNDFDVFHGPDFVLPPTKRPSVVTIHDLSFIRTPELGEPALVRYLQAAVPRSLRRADQVITVSASVAAELVEAYPFVEEIVRAIPNGVSAPATAVCKRIDPSDRPTILIVGTIEPRKNHLALLAAMPAVWQHYPEAELVVAGRIGWQSDQIVVRLAEAARTLPVRIEYQPSDAQLEELFGKATVFVYPSRYEGFGFPVLEAMMRHVPVVAGDIAALRETGGDAALYANPDDPEALGDQILEVLGDEQLRQQLVSAGRERAAGYSWAETARRTRRAYAAAIDRSQR